MSVILFIDTNQYLKLYGLAFGNGKKLLESLEAQKAHIFVSAQIVDEVLRNKFGCAKLFFFDRFKEIDAIGAPVPDHLVGIDDTKAAEFRKIFKKAAAAKTELTKLAADALSRIGTSKDEVSRRLKKLFDSAISPSADEMQRARERKERGNPPGKRTDPLGDQITWEQFLSYCKQRNCKGLWIITEDQDYFIKHENSLLLNPLLNRDVTNACGAGVEIHCFDNLLVGIEDFVRNAGVKAKKRLTEAESTTIKNEIEALPRLHSLATSMDAATRAQILINAARQHFTAPFFSGATSDTPLALKQGSGDTLIIGDPWSDSPLAKVAKPTK